MKIAASLALAALMSTAAAGQSMDVKINVGTDSSDGVCRIYLPNDAGMELQISVRANDGNTVVSVEKIPAAWTEGGDDKDVPITLVFDNGKRFVTDEGAYRAGFTYKVLAAWSNKADGPKILPLLKGGQTISATFDGKKAGPFTIQAHSANIKDYAFTFMQNCLKEARSPVKL